MSYFENIEKQEKKDRFVATKCLEQILSAGTDLQLTATSVTDYVDLYGEITNKKGNRVPFTVEIKERFKDNNQLAKYPNAELKLEKLERMKSQQKGVLLYMVLLNESECLLFNLSKMDWNEIPFKNWRIKQTQMNPNSPYKTYPTYFIPYDKAIKKIDCSKYF